MARSPHDNTALRMSRRDESPMEEVATQPSQATQASQVSQATQVSGQGEGNDIPPSRMGALLGREWLLAGASLRQQALFVGWVLGCSLLFPLAFGAEGQQLQAVASPLMWSVWLLGGMIVSDAAWRDDYANGFCRLMYARGLGTALGLVKMVTSYLLMAVTMTVTLPWFLLVMGIPVGQWVDFLVGLHLGLVGYVAMGQLMTVILLGTRHVSLLLAVLMIPLLVPIVIFGSAMVAAPTYGLSAILMGYGLLLVILAVIFVPLALRMAVE